MAATPQDQRALSRSSVSSQGRDALWYGLDTIIEETEVDADQRAWPVLNRHSRLQTQRQHLSQKLQQRRVDNHNNNNSNTRHPTHPAVNNNDDDDDTDDIDIDTDDDQEQWLSPLSDHFPTPRGFHFLPAPILPATPSTSSFDPAVDDRDDADDASSAGTDNTEFDDLCEVTDGEDDGDCAPRHAATARAFLPPLVIPSRQASSTLATDGLTSPVKDQDGSNKCAWMSPEMAQAASAVQLSPQAIDMVERHQANPIPDISAPPSLDGSLASEQMAGLSSPPTPILGPGDDGDDDDVPPSVKGDQATWSGIRLDPAALAILRLLSWEQGENDDGINDGGGLGETEAGQGVIEVAFEQPLRHSSSCRQSMAGTRQETLRLIFAQLHGASNGSLLPASLGQLNSSVSSGSPDGDPSSRASGSPVLTPLEVPSPNTFFANLAPGTRQTWGCPAIATATTTTVDDEPLNSGAAERFYRTPWDEPQTEPKPPAGQQRKSSYRKWFTSGSPVEHVVEVSSRAKHNNDDATDEDEDDNQSTARPLNTAIRLEQPPAPPGQHSDVGGGDSLEAIEIILETDPVQAHQQQSLALAQLDRMGMWLAAQRAYLPTVMPKAQPPPFAMPEPQEEEKDKGEGEDGEKPLPNLPQEVPVSAPAAGAETKPREAATAAVAVTSRKKSVRFSSDVAAGPKATRHLSISSAASNTPRELPSTLFRRESAYYRAFTDYMVRQHPSDVFVHRQPRFEALQAQRASLHESHRRQLLGKFQLSVVPQSLKKRLSANVARGDAELVDDPARLRREKEAEAADQMAMSLWHVAAMKHLAGGRLIRAPVARRLARASRMAPGPDGVPRDRARILDLGGQAACDWAWHCAHSYPNTKVYTVSTRAARQLANSNMRGPPNHRHVAVAKLSRLPFADGSFDLVSARELHALLKAAGPSGEDEWDACLAECLRVLKPGGYLDFSVLDSDMINPGPLGLAKSVEFGFTLRTLGYDPTPTRSWLARLARAGFQDVRRAWVCLPMGEKPTATPRPQPSSSSSSSSSTSVAAVAGIAAGWSWERWLLRCETERVASEQRLCTAETATSGEAVREAAGRCLADVHAVVDEGRACGAAWRMVMGWARKPRAGMGMISIGLAE